jgi:tRNA A37 methylthiotransferase MiaB
VLTGVNLGDFGIRNGKREDKFFDLVKALDEVEGIERIRISSIEPNLLTDEIIRLWRPQKGLYRIFISRCNQGLTRYWA